MICISILSYRKRVHDDFNDDENNSGQPFSGLIKLRTLILQVTFEKTRDLEFAYLSGI